MHLPPLTQMTWYEFMSDGELATMDKSFTNDIRTCLELDLNCISALRL
jgi:hypothetical protein